MWHCATENRYLQLDLQAEGGGGGGGRQVQGGEGGGGGWREGAGRMSQNFSLSLGFLTIFQFNNFP